MDTSNSATFDSLDFIFDKPVGLKPLTHEQTLIFMKRVEKLLKPYLSYLGMKDAGDHDRLRYYASRFQIQNIRAVEVISFNEPRVAVFLTDNGQWIYVRSGGQPNIEVFSSGEKFMNALVDMDNPVAFGWIFEGVVAMIGRAQLVLELRLEKFEELHRVLARWNAKNDAINENEDEG
jgi:hypothetical protein